VLLLCEEEVVVVVAVDVEMVAQVLLLRLMLERMARMHVVVLRGPVVGVERCRRDVHGGGVAGRRCW
jgi:hypothetical protein